MTDAKKIFIVWGYSDVGGHDAARKARPLAHGEDVFYFNQGQFEQNPQEPVFGHKSGAGSSTPMRYFADKLAGLTNDDIAFMGGDKAGHHWHDGISGISRSAIAETIAMLQPALDQGWELGGLILATGPGDADTRNG